jgi:hypothetical protein
MFPSLQVIVTPQIRHIAVHSINYTNILLTATMMDGGMFRKTLNFGNVRNLH